MAAIRLTGTGRSYQDWLMRTPSCHGGFKICSMTCWPALASIVLSASHGFYLEVNIGGGGGETTRSSESDGRSDVTDKFRLP